MSEKAYKTYYVVIKEMIALGDYWVKEATHDGALNVKALAYQNAANWYQCAWDARMEKGAAWEDEK